MTSIRAARPDDLPRLRLLNEGAVPHVNSLTLENLRALLDMAALFLVAEEETQEAEQPSTLAFLLVLPPQAAYESPNFLWFRDRYQSFLYVDRIIVAPHARGLGLGSELYRRLVAWAPPGSERIACEVNLRPSNEGSLRFHEVWGFQAVGRQETEGGAKEVSLQVLTL